MLTIYVQVYHQNIYSNSTMYLQCYLLWGLLGWLRSGLYRIYSSISVLHNIYTWYYKGLHGTGLYPGDQHLTAGYFHNDKLLILSFKILLLMHMCIMNSIRT